MVWIPIIGILASSTMVVLVVFFVTRGRQRRVEAQVEMQAKLIDRFGSAPELVSFLHSPAGRQFITGVQSAPDVLTRERILSGFTRAVVLSSLGLAFLVPHVPVRQRLGGARLDRASRSASATSWPRCISYKLSAKVRAGELEPSASRVTSATRESSECLVMTVMFAALTLPVPPAPVPPTRGAAPVSPLRWTRRDSRCSIAARRGASGRTSSV